MNPRDLKEIFASAVAMDPAARADYLDRACAADAALRREIDALLAAHDRAPRFMDHPTAAKSTPHADVTPAPPDRDPPAERGSPLEPDSPLERDSHRVPLERDSHLVPDPAGIPSGDTAEPHSAHVSTTRAAGESMLLPITEKPGAIIGRYKLLQEIGEGGFGVVFMAEQREPVQRKVALKIIKLGMDTRQVIARFEAERQALALMDHPNIARVLDGSATDSGRPFFVMEYVRGDPITDFADHHKLGVRDRLDLFMQVCNAVQHAHTKGVIHRDIKPRNVLVSMVDGRPHAKVIDFGIAKATGGRLTEKTLFTEHRQLIGTPEYMSPEQAEGSPDIDTRTDVYALGVLLYELLTGVTPFDAKRLRSAAFAEMQRIIREEEPPMPSLRILRSSLRSLKPSLTPESQQSEPRPLGSGFPSNRTDFSDPAPLPHGRGSDPSHSAPRAASAGPASRLAALAAARQSDPATLGTLIKGDLDWIVMKALDKERARRYESANQFAADVQRHLAGEPVLAAPPSVGYRVRKFVRRNRGPVVAGSAVATALLVGIAGLMWGWSAATETNRRIQAQAAIARAGLRGVATAMGGDPDEFVEMMPQAFEDGRRARAEDRGERPKPMEKEEVELRALVSVAESSTKRLKEQTDAAVRQRDMIRSALESLYKPGDVISNDLEAVAYAAREAVRLRPEFQQVPEEDRPVWEVAEIARYATGQYVRQLDGAEWSAYTANLALAQAAVAAHEFPEARRVLALTPVGKRGWEWTFLTAQAESTIVVLEPGDKAAWFSEDSKRVQCLTHGSDTMVEYDVESGTRRPVHSLAVGTPLVGMLSDDGLVVVAPGTVKQHDRAQRILLDRLVGLGGFVGYASFSPDGLLAVLTAADIGTGDASTRLVRLAQWGGPERSFDDRVYLWRNKQDADHSLKSWSEPRLLSLRLSACLDEPAISGITVTTPNGTRRIVGSGDKTVRFYEAKDGKPTLPATAQSPEGVFREIAVFRLPEAVTNLQMTGDGTRLVIHLADGSARVWDIRHPDERRKDMQAEWVERVSAGAYLDALWASDAPDDKLRDAIINDAGLPPLRRLVAANMLEERLEDDRFAAEQAFAAISKGQTDKAAVQAAAAAADLPRRVKARAVTSAAEWEYKPPEPSDAEKLAAESRERELAEATAIVRTLEQVDKTARDAGEFRETSDIVCEQVRKAFTTRLEYLGQGHPDVADAVFVLCVYCVREPQSDYDVFAQLATHCEEPCSVRTDREYQFLERIAFLAMRAGKAEDAAHWYHVLGARLLEREPLGWGVLNGPWSEFCIELFKDELVKQGNENFYWANELFANALLRVTPDQIREFQESKGEWLWRWVTFLPPT